MADRARSAILFFNVALLATASSFPPYQLNSWTTANGLPHDSIQTILQTRDGFLWLPTLNGLARFDGLNFRVFRKGTTKGLTSNAFSMALWEDRSGALWAATRDAGVTRYQNGEFRTFTVADGLPSNQVLRIDEDDRGVLWFYTAYDLAIWKDGHFKRMGNAVASPLVLRPNRMQMGYDSPYFGFWRLGSNGWERFAYGKWSPFPIPASIKDPSELRIGAIYEDSKRRLWYGVENGPHSYCVDKGKLIDFAGFKGSASGRFVDYQDADGFLWFTDHQGYTGRWKNGQTERFEGISTVLLFRVIEDHEGNMWIATRDQGLFRLRPPAITSIRHPGSSEIGSAMIGDRNGTVWIGNIGLLRSAAGKFKSFLRIPSLQVEWSPTIISALQEDAAGKLWVGTREGLCTFKDGHFFTEPLGAYSKTPISALAANASGELAIGTESGVLFLKDGNVTPQATGPVRTLLYEEDSLWIGTRQGLFNFSKGRLLPRPDAWRFGLVNTLMRSRDESLWIGTEQNGIFRLLHGKIVHYERTMGLPDDSAQQILEDDAGFLWYGGRSGLFRMAHQELDQFAAGRLKKIQFYRFGKDDGLLRDDFMDSGQPGCFKSKDGRLWFSTFGTIAIVDPAQVPLDPPIGSPIIDQCVLNRNESGCGQDIIIHPRDENLEIRYTAINLTKPDQIRFKYRLKGLDDEWVDAERRRTAYYSHLPPGRYSFEVLAANGDGVWSTTAAAIPVSVLPAFYWTWWFLLLSISCAAAFLQWIWRRRVFTLRQAHAVQQAFSRQLIESQERERKRIAAELHDSLGQRLVMINNLALLALEKQENEEQNSPLRKISSEASQAIGEMKDISYNLRPFRLDRLGLTKTLEWIIRSTASAAQISVSTDLANIDRMLPKDSEINLFRIVQESLGNIVKHSRATDVTVSLTLTGSKLVLIITDNGLGFGQDTRPDDASAGGFGLIGISERAMLLGGKARIESMPGRGTRVHVEIQLTTTRQ